MHKTIRLKLEGEVVPSVYIKPSEYVRFPKVKHGSGAVKTLTVEGEKGRPLEITNVRSSEEYIKAAIAKDDETGRYTLTVTLEKDAPPGVVRKGTVSFDTNYEERPTMKVQVSASVQGPIDYPATVFFSLSKQRPDQLTKEITLTSSDGDKFKIKGVETDIPDKVATTLETLEKKKKYRITLQYIGKMEVGSFSGNLTVRTNHKTQPVIEIPVRGRVTARSRAGRATSVRPPERPEPAVIRRDAREKADPE